MRISDWVADVFSSDLASAAAPTRLRPIRRKAWAKVAGLAVMRAEVFWWKNHGGRCGTRRPAAIWMSMSAKLVGSAERHRVVTGTRASVLYNLRGLRIITKKTKNRQNQITHNNT